MNILQFDSLRRGINVNAISWYSWNEDVTTLRIKMLDGENFLISDEIEIDRFFVLLPLMEWEDETEEE